MGSTLLDAGFLYCILSASSLDPNSSGLQAPSVGWGLPYHISSLTLWGPLATASGLSENPLGRVWPSLPHLVSNPLGVSWQLHRGVFRVPPRSGVAFPTTSGLYCLEFYWQLHRGFPRTPSVGCSFPYIWSLLSGILLTTALGPKLN